MSENTVPQGLEVIDFSSVQVPITVDPTDWEAPKHVYFGKKLANGKMEKEPVYVYSEYPRMLYGRVDGKVRVEVVKNDEDRDALLAEGWVKNPAELGIITAPGFEDHLRMKQAKEAIAIETATETVEIVKRKPGRPKAS